MTLTKLRVGIYLRLSNEDRDKINKEDESESIKNQRSMLIDYINKHKEFILIDEYCDENLSGAGTYRREFERLIRDCEERKLDVVLCKSQSRFSRDMEIVEKYINNKFIEWNIRFIGIADNADTEIIGNKKSRQINGLVNEWYLEDVSNNIRSAFYSKMKKGDFISPFAPYGYLISPSNNNKLIIDNESSLIVKRIFNLYLKGYSFTKIANILNTERVASPSLYKYKKGIKLNIVSNKPIEEIKWSINSIKTILTNEIYIGNLIQGKRTTISYKNHKIRFKDKKEWIKSINTHDPIIDKELFDKVQILIKERTKPLRKDATIHIFSGKVFCYSCNKYLRKKNSKLHEYLVCSICKLSIRYDLLSNLILDSINKKIDNYYDINILKELDINNNYKNNINNLEKTKNDFYKKIFNSNNYIKNLFEDRVNNIITIDNYKLLINSYNSDIKYYKEQINLINNEINKHKCFDDNIFYKYKKIDILDKIIIDSFIDKIYIDKTKDTLSIHIKWDF